MAVDVLARRPLGRTVGRSRADRYDETLALAAYPVPDGLWDGPAELTPAGEHWLGER